MKVYQEATLKNFEFWGGAVERVNCLTFEELDQIESILEDCYPDGISETTLNDIFWFDEDWIAEMLGYESFEEIWNR